MNETALSKMDWRRLWIEGAVIAASILLAFGVDAWWASRQERADEILTLQAMLSDLQVIEFTLQHQSALHDAMRDSGLHLLSIGRDPTASISPREMDIHLGNTMWWGDSSRYKSAALDAAVSNGSERVLSNLSLTQDLARFALDLDRHRNSIDDDHRFTESQWLPFLSERVDITQIFSRITHAPGHETSSYDLYQDFDTTNRDHTSLLTDPVFQNMLLIKVELQSNALVTGATRIEGGLRGAKESVMSELRVLGVSLADRN